MPNEAQIHPSVEVGVDSPKTAALDQTPKTLAYIYTAGFFFLSTYVIMYGVAPESKDLVNTLVGILSAGQVGIMSYYFGSSSGSARKTEMMGRE